MSEPRSLNNVSPEKLEQEVYLLTWLLQVASELSTILAREESEKGYLTSVDWIRKAFGADKAALYSIDSSDGRFRYVSGTTSAEKVSTEEWEEIKRLCLSEASSRETGPRLLPGYKSAPSHWLAARLDFFGRGEGCILLGTT
ncbi:MAG: hypothetical protein WCL50_05250, partial [Spirochaetota bacterium]